MNKRAIGGYLGIIALLFFSCFLSAQTPAQSATQSQNANSTEQASPEEAPPTGQVVIEGRLVLTVYETLGTRAPEQRALDIGKRIVSIARDTAISPEAIVLLPHASYTFIVAGDETVMALTDADAKMAGKPRQKLAEEYANSIGRTIQTYRQEHSWRMILRGMLKTTIATLVLLLVLWLVRKTRFILRDRIQWWIHATAQREKKSAWQLSMAYIGPIALGFGAFVRWLFILALFEAYLTVVLGFFSFSRAISLTVTDWTTAQVSSLARSALDYLPNVLVLAVIALITNYAIRLNRLIFGEIRKGEVKIRGFYPDWAEPTEKLIRMLVLILALIVAFPYLPGAKSPAFQGISIFVGVLLSLGSSSAVANAVAGVILTYMRSFLLEDWVQIGDTTGEVIEKNLLVTRILTPKAEVITIPNATVMSGAVKNYTVEAKKAGVIFHTTVTIGYDAPWRTVHELLTSAALATKRVLREPAPFVLQNALSDFYVAYELNAYTDMPREVLNIYSDLHKNIQDKFNEAGVEICSPHFSALRDGNTVTIPQQYHPAGYRPPGFRIEPNQKND
jgi:small-conductance mechanosensitive channel